MPTWQEVSTAAADLANAQEQLRTYGQIASLYEREVELLRRKAQRAAQDADSAEVLATQKRERVDEDSGALASKKADLGRLQATIQDTEAVIAEAYRAIEESNIKRMFESDDVSADPDSPPPKGQSRPVQDVRNGRIVSLPEGGNNLQRMLPQEGARERRRRRLQQNSGPGSVTFLSGASHTVL